MASQNNKVQTIIKITRMRGLWADIYIYIYASIRLPSPAKTPSTHDAYFVIVIGGNNCELLADST